MSEDVKFRSPPESRGAAGGTHAQTFQVREAIWTTFESMARKLGIPVDDLVNDAMEHYARARGHLEEVADAYEEDPERTAARVSLDRSRLRAEPRAPLPPPGLPMPRVPPPPARRPSRVRTVPPPLPGVPPATPRVLESPPVRSGSAPRTLTLEYRGRSYLVDKDRFSIGRAKSHSDLRLHDPNVSRQHAVIERVGTAWYIVDLGSTNGVEIAGERVARRALADGDVIVITTHEIRCSLG